MQMSVCWLSPLRCIFTGERMILVSLHGLGWFALIGSFCLWIWWTWLMFWVVFDSEALSLKLCFLPGSVETICSPFFMTSWRHLVEPNFSRALDEQNFQDILTSQVCKTSGRDFLHYSGKFPCIYHYFQSFSDKNPGAFQDLEIAGQADLCFLSSMELLERRGLNCSWMAAGLVIGILVGAKPSWKATGHGNLEIRDFWWQAQLEGDRATTAIWELEIFWWQAQLESDRATAAIWELEVFGGNLGTRDFWWQAQLEGDRATIAIWELEIFWWQAQLESDRATAAIWELEVFGGRPSWKATGLQLQSGYSRFLVAGPSWKATGLHLQSGNSRFFVSKPRYNCDLGTRVFSLVAGPAGRRQGYNCDLGTRDLLMAGPVGRRQWLFLFCDCCCSFGHTEPPMFRWQSELSCEYGIGEKKLDAGYPERQKWYINDVLMSYI